MVPVCYLPLPETGPQVCSLDLYRSPTLTLICGQIKLKSHCFESCGIRNNVDMTSQYFEYQTVTFSMPARFTS